MNAILIFFCIIVCGQTLGYDPVFDQQFTTYMSTTLGTVNYTYYFDFPGQRQRTDFSGAHNTSVTVYQNQFIYGWYVVDDEVVDCQYYKSTGDIPKFAWPSGLYWVGFATVNDIACDEYLGPTLPPFDKYWVTRSNPTKPVRSYIPPSLNTPELQTDYYTFEYSVDPNVFVTPTNCKQV